MFGNNVRVYAESSVVPFGTALVTDNTCHRSGRLPTFSPFRDARIRPLIGGRIQLVNTNISIAFLGAGKMATAFARGLTGKGVFAVDEILASDPSSQSRDAFSNNTGAKCINDNDELVRRSSRIVLAVKPQIAESVLVPFRGRFGDKLLVSIAAGLPIEKISQWIGSRRVVRVMPNTPVAVGFGASVFACSLDISEDDRTFVKTILEAVGIALEMPEEKLDAVTAVSGSGPAYVFEFIQALVDAAMDAGIDANAAHDLVVQTVRGAVEMVANRLGTPDELRDAVTSPGGTTAAGLRVFRDGDFRSLVRLVVAKAAQRSVELRGVQHE